jgi:hypothetical protein
LCGEEKFVRREFAAIREGVFMKTLIHFKRHGDGYFHVHPLHATFALVASFVLPVLIMLVLVSSAR